MIAATAWLATLVAVDREAVPEQCGLYRLEVIAERLSKQPLAAAAVDALKEARPPYSQGELAAAAIQMGFDSEVIAIESRQVAFDCHAILATRISGRNSLHFVACLGRVGDAVCILDFPSVPTLVDAAELAGLWTGDAVLIDIVGSPELARIRKGLATAQSTRFLGVGSAVLGLIVLFAARHWKRCQGRPKCS